MDGCRGRSSSDHVGSGNVQAEVTSNDSDEETNRRAGREGGGYLCETSGAIGKAERLDPELEEYLVDEGPRGLCLRHPLVQQFDVSAERAALWNKIYKDKMRAVEQAIENGDWHGYVFLRERPWRLDAFVEIQQRLEDGGYWTLLSEIWLDSEFPSREGDLVRATVRRGKPIHAGDCPRKKARRACDSAWSRRE